MNKIAKHLSTVIAIIALFTASACVSKTDIETLQLERQQDLNRIKQLEAELEESRQLLKEEIENSQNPVRQRAADMWAEMQTLRTEMAKFRGEMDLMHIRMDRQIGDSNSTMTMDGLKDQLDEIEFVLENQLQVDLPKIREERAASLAAHAQAVETTSTSSTVVGAPTASETVTQSIPAASQAAPTPPTTNDTDPAKALYDKAYTLYKEGQFEKARSYWAEFTDTFKGHAFSASAFFWQGQCYYKLKDYARAAILFEDVIEKFKKSSKYKSALLKAGYSWNYLGKPELAKMRMEEVVKKFPKSVEATQAKRFLDKAK
ncbi:tetratricopeptide repeat protein [Pseudodesulfovibrio sp. zrk46]|uniref:tetratricopeptide repeat protein n=1 Tax=Pseudodesulfovibrio sp. zrk46 TaxID=2725288 RepID=UPI001449154D|nr:tetratricopeptide repeat protein [Pseudodesulfovibrio sp. zrk46]QJB57790.1 tetratricopeptide repeat protein [Pseudodesulfovibrio sp. zrk46]